MQPFYSIPNNMASQLQNEQRKKRANDHRNTETKMGFNLFNVQMETHNIPYFYMVIMYNV